RQRPQIRVGEAVGPNDVERRGAKLVEAERDSYLVERRRQKEPPNVRVEPEDRGAVRRFVTPHSLEHAGAILQPVRADVNVGVVPANELAVEPDEIGFGERSHCRESVGVESMSEYAARRGLRQACIDGRTTATFTR